MQKSWKSNGRFSQRKNHSACLPKKGIETLRKSHSPTRKEIYAALREDLNKSKTETFMCEVG